TYLSPCLTARVFIPETSEPASGSLNLFLNDIYHGQKILTDKAVPEELVLSASHYRPEFKGVKVPHGIYIHICGTDLVRDDKGEYFVLEDNGRCPSGASYMLENRHAMKRAFPGLLQSLPVRPVDAYGTMLRETLAHLAPKGVLDPVVVVLTPGIYNSAYFEHGFLAQQMGVELVTGGDLAVKDGYLWMRTTRGYRKVDVLYRRIDDDFLDPRAFRSDSLLGVPGLMDVYRSGKVAVANAPGTGVADDKVIYAYVPQIVKYYLGEDILIPNVETWMCWVDSERKYVLDHMSELVIKTANDSGGYGVLIGPHATQPVLAEWAARIVDNPRNFIAQRTLSLSRAPVMVGSGCEGRHVDLRPFVLYGRDIYVMPGGLTRVALKKGSLVVNSSQGGGSKDTWVLGSTSVPNGMAPRHAEAV
ncbi:MAG TPA: circularly permuted type 2 ATP-grasp protein, partial [Fibrobacteria bacterium]|nr:circularly permuted type 2 ATP-grasp protein [Fibrobacteria bacterium]